MFDEKRSCLGLDLRLSTLHPWYENLRKQQLSKEKNCLAFCAEERIEKPIPLCLILSLRPNKMLRPSTVFV